MSNFHPTFKFDFRETNFRKKSDLAIADSVICTRNHVRYGSKKIEEIR